jgi:Xaa-Pro dipeptidase
VLKTAIETSRVVKDEFEVAMLRKANYISGIGHRAVFARAKTAKNEQEFEAAFKERCYSHGVKKMSYDPIAAAGRAAATLHYVGNDAPLDGKLNLLMDAGGEWNNYAADIVSANEAWDGLG